MIAIEKSSKNMAGSIVSLCLLTTLILGGTYLLYTTKPLPTTYAYEKALQEATETPHIAKLAISPKISYGGNGAHSLRKITQTLQLLSESNTNKGLVIDLVPGPAYDKDKASPPSAFVAYTILKDELQAYKDKTKRKIIVHVTQRLDMSPFLLILAIADKVILDTKTILNTKQEEFFETIEAALDRKARKASKTQAQKADHSKIREGGRPSFFKPIYSGDYKLNDDPEENDKMWQAYHHAILDAISTLEQKRGVSLPKLIELTQLPQLIQLCQFPVSNNKEEEKTPWEAWKESLCTYLADYNSSEQEPEEVENYIKTQIEQVPIIDLQPCIKDNYTAEYTSQQRNAHRRTEACFETIMISGVINPDLVMKMKPLIQSLHCDPNIKGVIIVWDSPGGEVLSAEVLLHLLKKLDATKPVIHVAGGTCASAAYLLAASTGVQLTAYPKAAVGSIGAISDIAYIIYNAEKTRKELDEIRKWMIEQISENRAANHLDVNPEAYGEKLWDTEARTYIASRAKEEQLIDEIGTLQDAIEALKEHTGLDLPVYYSENEIPSIYA